jgi:hypothetical protein
VTEGAGYFLHIARELLGLVREKLFGGGGSPEACEAVLRWAAEQDLPPGAARVLDVPARVASLRGRRTAHALRTSDGRHFVLLKSTGGWKGNFEGTLCADGPLAPGEFVGEHDPRPYISVGDASPWQELYVRRRIDERHFEVYFDLN